MDIGVLITAVVGIITSIASGWTSWFFTRKKYNSEVDQNVIHNMNESLEFYKKLSDDNKQRLDEMIKRNDELEDEIKELRKQMTALMMMTCKDLTCKLRQVSFELNKDNNNKDEEKSRDTI